VSFVSVRVPSTPSVKKRASFNDDDDDVVDDDDDDDDDDDENDDDDDEIGSFSTDIVRFGGTENALAMKKTANGGA
jgi:hypothetical protein